MPEMILGLDIGTDAVKAVLAIPEAVRMRVILASKPCGWKTALIWTRH